MKSSQKDKNYHDPWWDLPLTELERADSKRAWVILIDLGKVSIGKDTKV